MPVLFVGHGSPNHAIEQNLWSRGFQSLRDVSPTPVAIVVISAHWYTNRTLLSASAQPHTIHDFSGFAPELYEIQYNAPGHPRLAKTIMELIGQERAELDPARGLDHGTWSVLRWMYPEATIPVIQLSINQNLSMQQHFEIDQALRELRDQGVLIVASGNMVHNLKDAFSRMRSGSSATPEWATQFDSLIASILEQRDAPALLRIWPHHDLARQAHPHPDHWIPLMYAVGASDANDVPRFPATGFDLGSISMRNVVFG